MLARGSAFLHAVPIVFPDPYGNRKDGQMKEEKRKQEKIDGNRSIRSQGSFDMLDRINAVVTQRRRKKESKLFET